MKAEKKKVVYASCPDGPKSVSIEKIKNGFTIRSFGMNGEEAQFVKNLSKAPSIMARLLGVKGEKSPGQIEDMVEESDE